DCPPDSVVRSVARSLRHQVGRTHGTLRARDLLHDVFHASDPSPTGAGVTSQLHARSGGESAGENSYPSATRRGFDPSFAFGTSRLRDFSFSGAGQGLGGKSSL